MHASNIRAHLEIPVTNLIRMLKICLILSLHFSTACVQTTNTCDIMGTSASSSALPKNSCEVVIVGGGYGGIQVAIGLDSYCKVTLIDPKDAFHHNMAGLRCVVEPSFVKKTLIPYAGVLKHGSFVQDRVVSCNISRTTVTLASGREISYDYLVFACGSSVPFPGKILALYTLLLILHSLQILCC